MAATNVVLDVQRRNPGEFLACCGLLSLAHVIDPDTTGWFDCDKFHLNTTANLWDNGLAISAYLLDFDESRYEELRRTKKKKRTAAQQDEFLQLDRDRKAAPVELQLDGGVFRVDWWRDERMTRSGFKTWSAGMTPIGFIEGMLRHIAQLGSPAPTFDVMPISDPSPFNFDSRLARLNPRDLGFAPPKEFASVLSPLAELLSLVGLQRFRPTPMPNGRYRYATWANPLPCEVATVAATGLASSLNDAFYEFEILRPDDYHKFYGPAEIIDTLAPIQGDTDA